MSNGLNSIKAEMDFTFQGNKESMKSLLRRIEKATTGTITGDIAFSGTEDCINFGELKHGVQIDLDTDYYKNFEGSQISNYNLKHISSDFYELNISMFNNRVSPVLNNGMGFVADRTVDISNSPFEKFDVIGRKVTGFTLDGVSGTDGTHLTGDWLWIPSTRQGQRLADSNDLIFESSNIFQISDNDFNPFVYANQLNVDYPWNVTSWTTAEGNPSNLPVFSNFKYKKYNSNSFDDYFYLTDDRSSAVTASNISGLATYTGIADDATRTFFWEPDQQVSLPVDHRARINDFKRSFTQQLNISRNQNRIDALDLTFTNRSEKETYSILHFLETHLGYKQFVYYYDDDIIQQNRVFFCPQWKHTFNYKDSNTIEARFIEIVAPVIPFEDDGGVGGSDGGSDGGGSDGGSDGGGGGVNSFRYFRFSGANNDGSVAAGSKDMNISEIKLFEDGGTEYPTTALTSNTSEAGITISAGAYLTSYDPWKAFNDSGVTSMWWIYGAVDEGDHWLQIDLGQSREITGIDIQSYFAQAFTTVDKLIIYSSNDGSTFSEWSSTAWSNIATDSTYLSLENGGYPGTQIVVTNSSVSSYNDIYTYNSSNQRYEKSSSNNYYFYRDTDANKTWRFHYLSNIASETSPGNNDFGETAWTFLPLRSPATLTLS